VTRALGVADRQSQVTFGEVRTEMPTLSALDVRPVEQYIAEGLRERLRDTLTGELRGRRDDGTDTTSIEEALSDLDGETPLTEYVWVHAFYGEPQRRFEPHYRLDGERFTGGPTEDGRSPVEEDDRLVNDTDWPEQPYYFPGDHLGCTCELVAQVPSAIDSFVDAVQ
jgi:hypothetical protein